MTPEAMKLLYRYNYWAFERLWECVMALSDEQFVQPIDYSTGSIRNHLVHVMSATRRWLDRLQGGALAPHLAFEDFPTRAAAKSRWDELKKETLAYVDALDANQLEAGVTWELPARGLHHTNRCWEVLLHVANHATDHRSQMLAMLHTQLHAPTIEQDLIFYLMESDEASKSV